MYLALLAYVYVALALRENVLLVNGSAIRSWWICHHYWSAGCCLLLLALPIDSPSMHRFCEAFLLWSCFQAAIMFLYNRYARIGYSRAKWRAAHAGGAA